jgi:hypothetical protein
MNFVIRMASITPGVIANFAARNRGSVMWWGNRGRWRRIRSVSRGKTFCGFYHVAQSTNDCACTYAAKRPQPWASAVERGDKPIEYRDLQLFVTL